MLAIASTACYAASWFECRPPPAHRAGAGVSGARAGRRGRLRGLVPATARQWQAFALCGALALFSFGLTGAHGNFSPPVVFPPGLASASSRQNYWLDLKEQYGLPEGASYLMYVEGMGVDTWSERYVVRYALYSPLVDFCTELDEEQARGYDYLVFCTQDDASRAFLESLGLDPNAGYADLRYQW